MGYSLYQSLPDRLPWIQSYEQALKQARQEGKLVLAYLYTDWCGYCKQMEAETFTDKAVIDEMSDSYVWLKLNAETDEEGRQLQERFNITRLSRHDPAGRPGAGDGADLGLRPRRSLSRSRGGRGGRPGFLRQPPPNGG